MEAVWSHFTDILRSWVEGAESPKREFTETANYTSYFTDLAAPLFNGVIQKSPKALQDLDRQILFFLQSPVPFVWWVDPLKGRSDEGKKLEKRGLHPAGTYTGIFAPVQMVSFPAKEGVEIREIDHFNEMEIFAKILGPNFHFDETCMKKYCLMMKEFGEAKPYRHYLGYLNGKAVGAVSLFCPKGDVCGIWNLGVTPQARGRGVATELAKRCMNEAALLSFSSIVAILMAEKMASAVFKKFGFQEVCHLVPYVFGYNPKQS